MQKRGVMVDAEDFRDVTGTYPRHPMMDIDPDVKTQTELKKYRARME
jgi:hypothetical protein